MKLAIVRQKYTPYGGAERIIERMLPALTPLGIDVTVVARRWQGVTNGLTVNPFFLGRTWRDAGFARAVQRVIAERRFNLVQSHERIPGCEIYRAGDGVHATWLDLRGKATDRMAPWHRYTLAAEAALFRHAGLRAVICNSRMVRDDIAERFGLAAEVLHVIHNGVDLDYFHPGLREIHRDPTRNELGIESERQVVLFVGSGFERKGLPALLEAMTGNDGVLWVVGRDKGEAVMRRLAESLGVAQRVTFFGGQTDLRPFFGAADVFALPTLYDPCPNAALEALACGLPLLTTTTCGAAEWIQSGVNGWVVKAHDVPQLADKLGATVRLAKFEGARAASRAAVSHLSFGTMATRFAELYSSLRTNHA